jgi:predicted SAM-dependent methyltransferase
MAISWEEAADKKPLYLNLGGRSHCEPHPRYRNYVSVDLSDGGGWRVVHDLRKPFPLADNSVDGIHSEDCLTYLSPQEIHALLTECYRVLKPEGRMRVGLFDFGHPRNHARVRDGKDTVHPEHRTITNKENVETLLRDSPFREWTFYHYWEGDTFVQKPIDYAYGWIQRTPEHDPRNRSIRPKGYLKNALFLLSRGFRPSAMERSALMEGQPRFITSLVFDCFKEKER